MRLSALAVFAAAVAGLGSCRILDRPPTLDTPQPTAPERTAEAVFRGPTQVDFWVGERLAWTLQTAELHQDLRRQRIHARPVDLRAFDGQGRQSAHILADSGSMDRGMRYFHASGHVKGINQNGMVLRTDSIVYDKDADRIHTAARVEVKTESGDRLSGRGFRSDAHLQHWEILADVTGTITDLRALDDPVWRETQPLGEEPTREEPAEPAVETVP